LKCLHCYSLSGPREREEVAASVLLAALTDAGQAGYGVASFSGGEPLLYKQLPALLHHAHDCGMITTVTTNGMLLDERKLETLQGAADLIAISLDGKPKSHNIMRASKQAFAGMLARLEGLRASEIPFGFIFTLTQYNLDELDWVASFALEQGARLLQIHPLEEVGRARAKLLFRKSSDFSTRRRERFLKEKYSPQRGIRSTCSRGFWKSKSRCWPTETKRW